MRRRFVSPLCVLALYLVGTIPSSTDVALSMKKCRPASTALIQARIDAAPDGSTVTLPDGCYLVETIRITARHSLRIDGTGTSLQAETDGAQNRVHVSIALSSAITVRGLAIVGADPTPGTWDGNAHAFQHGFAVNGSTDVLLDGVTVRNVYGDSVAVQKGSTPTGAVPSERVTVRDSTFTGAGRQGVSVSMGKVVTISGITMSKVGRSAFDLEPDTTSHVISDVLIENNTVSEFTNFFVASQGVGCLVDRVTIRGNTWTGGGITMKPPLNVPAGACRRHDATIEANVATLGPDDTNKGAWAVFGRYDNVTVRGNDVTIKRHISGVFFSQAAGLLQVADNRFCGATRAVGRDPASTGPIVESGNVVVC